MCDEKAQYICKISVMNVLTGMLVYYLLWSVYYVVQLYLLGQFRTYVSQAFWDKIRIAFLTLNFEGKNNFIDKYIIII